MSTLQQDVSWAPSARAQEIPRQGLMRNPAYWDHKHPQFPTYQRLIKRAFQILYPGDAKYDATGRMIDSPPLAPHIVAHQVDAVNREMAAMNDGPTPEPASDKTHDGMVHVESHTRDGGKTEVSDYWRNAPGHGDGAGESAADHGDNADKGGPENQNDPGQDTLPGQSGEDDLRSVSPVKNPRIRNDGEGRGEFGAKRKYGPHKGLDLEVESGDEVFSPVDGTIKRIAAAYPDPKYDGLQAITIAGDDGLEYKFLYVSPRDAENNPLIKETARVSAGDLIGLAQNRAAYEPSGKMKDHIHIEIRDKSGQLIDPTPHFKRWRNEGAR